jgi:hypothetical protein
MNPDPQFGGVRTNLADGMGAPTSSLASLEWSPRRTTVFCSPSAEPSLTEPRKVLLAGLLWKKTTVSQAWIGEHLGMKNAANASRVIYRVVHRGVRKIFCKIHEVYNGENERK